MAVENCPSSVNRTTGKFVLFRVRSPWVADLKDLPPKHTSVSLDHWKKEPSHISILQGSHLSGNRRLQPILHLFWEWPAQLHRHSPAWYRVFSSLAVLLYPGTQKWMRTTGERNCTRAVVCDLHPPWLPKRSVPVLGRSKTTCCSSSSLHFWDDLLLKRWNWEDVVFVVLSVGYQYYSWSQSILPQILMY